MLITRGISCWLLLDYSIIFTASSFFILFYNLFCCFWDTVIRVVKYKISYKIYVIKARYRLLVIARL